MTSGPIPKDIPRFQKDLLSWYDRNKRDLPWRGTKDPYAIFVSEMMLQQTQVKTVLPYYTRFLKELPDWKTLARAKEEKVLKLWEGLGYYRRARNLKAAAQRIVSDHGGKVPDTFEGIRELPGIGDYSAGAILSIAFGRPHPVVDGNVIRVLSRIFLLKGPLKAGPGHKKVWELASSLLSPKRPGDFNQALMELGATVCLPENPLCLLCPLQTHCGASQKGLQDKFPETAQAQATVEVPMAALLIEKNGKVLLRKRPLTEKWLKGLWEFPSQEGSTFEEALRKLERAAGARAVRQAVQEVKHQITHHRVQLKLFRGFLKKSGKIGAPYRWTDPKDLLKLPFSSAQGKFRQWWLEGSQGSVSNPSSFKKTFNFKRKKK